MAKDDFLHHLKQHLLRVVRHVFALGETGLGGLAKGGERHGLGAVCALVLPFAIHAATASNDVIAALTVTGLKPHSEFVLVLESVATALVWLGHVLGRD